MNDKQLKQLLIEITKHNNSKLEEFYLHYERILYGFAFTIIKTSEANDIVHNFICKLMNMNENKLPQDHIHLWLKRCIKNEALNYIKKIGIILLNISIMNIVYNMIIVI